MFERNSISIGDLQYSLESNESALDGLDKSVHKQIRKFSNSLEMIEYTYPRDKQYEEACRLIQELRKYLESITS